MRLMFSKFIEKWRCNCEFYSFFTIFSSKSTMVFVASGAASVRAAAPMRAARSGSLMTSVMASASRSGVSRASVMTSAPPLLQLLQPRLMDDLHPVLQPRQKEQRAAHRFVDDVTPLRAAEEEEPSLVAVRCPLVAGRCPLFAGRWSLFAARCPLARFEE